MSDADLLLSRFAITAHEEFRNDRLLELAHEALLS